MNGSKLSTCSTNESNIYWIIDVASSILSSPRWEAEVLSFVDEQCIIFDCEEENKFQYSSVHQEFIHLVDNVLRERLMEFGISENDFCDACLAYNEKCKECNEGGAAVKEKLDESVIKQIRAMGDFQGFKNMMLKRNMELQIEAMEALKNINGYCQRVHDNINFVEANNEVVEVGSTEKLSTNDNTHAVEKVLEISSLVINDSPPDISSLVSSSGIKDDDKKEKDKVEPIKEEDKSDTIIPDGSGVENEIENNEETTLTGQRTLAEVQLCEEDTHSKSREKETKDEEDSNLLKEDKCNSGSADGQEEDKGQEEQTDRENVHMTVQHGRDTGFGQNTDNIEINIDKQKKHPQLLLDGYNNATRTTKEKREMEMKKNPIINAASTKTRKSSMSARIIPSLIPPPLGARGNKSARKDSNNKNNQSLVTFTNDSSNSKTMANMKKAQAMKRHDKFRKAKYEKFLNEDKDDLDRKRREYHLKKQRDMIVKKHNEMRRKKATAVDIASSSSFPSSSSEVLTLYRGYPDATSTSAAVMQKKSVEPETNSRNQNSNNDVISLSSKMGYLVRDN